MDVSSEERLNNEYTYVGPNTFRNIDYKSMFYKQIGINWQLSYIMCLDIFVDLKLKISEVCGLCSRLAFLVQKKM